MISDLILTFCLAKAQLGIFDDRTIQNLKVVKDMKVVKTESAPVDGRIAVFEDIAIIEREINSFGEFKERPLTREPSLGLMVVQRSSDGRYGTSDGGIIVTVTKKVSYRF